MALGFLIVTENIRGGESAFNCMDHGLQENDLTTPSKFITEGESLSSHKISEEFQINNIN